MFGSHTREAAMSQGLLMGIIGLFFAVVSASAQAGAWQRAMDTARRLSS